MKFRPMLAANVEDIHALRYPLLCSPKIDGIRALLVLDSEGKRRLVSRTLKPIPNVYIRQVIEQSSIPAWTDGELTVGLTFNQSTSSIMTVDGQPNFNYSVFDEQILSGKPYKERLPSRSLYTWHDTLTIVEVRNQSELVRYEDWAIHRGYEGVILRDPNGKYKFGRSTLAEQGMLKLKRFVDGEAVVIGTEELMRNANSPVVNALGLTERASCKSELVPSGLMGALIVEDCVTNKVFKIGTGFTEHERTLPWPAGTIVKYKYQAHGMVDKPRAPVFLGIRHENDI